MGQSSNYQALTRTHPAYRAGWNDGRDTGLVIAMNVITRERAWLADAPTRDAARTFADGRLHDVQRTIAAAFRAGAA